MNPQRMPDDWFTVECELAPTTSRSQKTFYFIITGTELLHPPSPTPKKRDESCSICLESYFINHPEIAVRLSCKHVFGHSCIQRWLESYETCPLCRATVGLYSFSGTKSKFEEFLDKHNLTAVLAEGRSSNTPEYLAAADVRWVEGTQN